MHHDAVEVANGARRALPGDPDQYALTDLESMCLVYEADTCPRVRMLPESMLLHSTLRPLVKRFQCARVRINVNEAILSSIL